MNIFQRPNKYKKACFSIKGCNHSILPLCSYCNDFLQQLQSFCCRILWHFYLARSSITALKCTTAPLHPQWSPIFSPISSIFSICSRPVSARGGNDQYQSTRLPGSPSRWRDHLFIRYKPSKITNGIIIVIAVIITIVVIIIVIIIMVI